MRGTRKTTVAGLAIGLTLSAATAVRAQEAASLSPHGDLPGGLDCSACHTSERWRPLKRSLDFDHDRATSFALAGRHGEVVCARCHLKLRFDESELDGGDCSSCHVDVHQGRMRATCISCHNTSSFHDVAGVDLHARTSFPLTGAHLQIACESCHLDDRGGAFTSLDTDCVACHQRDFTSASSLDHVAAGFSTDCQDCHGDRAWGSGAAFDHITASGGFPLRGSHGVLRCESCHELPSLQPRFAVSGPDDCHACHSADYDRAHAGSDFPTACAGCHRETRWGDATFADHDRQFFPITSGAHRGRWDGCETCHTVPNDFRSFTCFNCHEHSQARMDDKHRGEVSGYAYDSRLCYQCHPDGRRDD